VSSSFQSIAALALVALAAAWLLWRVLAKRNQPGCGGGCGCPASEIKATLKSKPSAR
jgi:ABC-type nickel/cobalt efflux system permease component RcnA